MNFQTQPGQIGKMLRAFACAGVIIGPYMYAMARPEKTLKYLFERPTDQTGEFLKVDSSYNRLATEVAVRMRLPEQMRRTPNFDIRPALHTGLDFDLNGSFSPLFNGVVYVMIPQWANLSSIEDLKKVKINISGQEIDFSNIDLSRIDQTKLNFASNKNEKATPQPPEITIIPNETKSWFSRWFGSSPPPAPIIEPSQPAPVQPMTREAVLVQKLIETFYLSDDAKKYILGDQLEMASGPWYLISWFVVAGSFFLPFTLYTRLRLHYRTRFKRFLFFHFLLFNGLLCLYLSPFLGRLINMQVSRMRDSSTISNGLDLLDGGIEFLDKQLQRNRILRELLPNGKDLFDADGERTKTRVQLPYFPELSIPMYRWSPLIRYRLKRLQAKMDQLMNLSELEARRTIFKPSPTPLLLKRSSSTTE